MKQASLLRRIGTYLLGLVDEYWAMRGHFGSTEQKNPNAGWSAMATIANAPTEPSCQGSVTPTQNRATCCTKRSVHLDTKQCDWLFMCRAAALLETRGI